MEQALIDKVWALGTGDRMRINGMVFRISKKTLHEGNEEDDPEQIHFELNEPFGLEVQGDSVTFYKNIERMYFVGLFYTCSSKMYRIKDFEILPRS